MKARWISHFIFFIYILNGFSQDNFYHKDDSLQTLLSQPISDSLRAKVLETLHFLWKNKNFEKSIDYSKQSIDFAEKKIGHEYTLGLRYQLGFAYMQAGDAVKSIQVFQEIIKEVQNEPLAYSTGLAFIAMNFENQADFISAIRYQTEASMIFESFPESIKLKDSRAYLGNPHKLGQLYLKNKQLDSAKHFANIALERLNKSVLTEWDQFFSWYIKILMGNISHQQKEYFTAMDYYNQSEREILKFQDFAYNYTGDLIPVYLGRANVFQAQGRLPSAIRSALSAFYLADTLKVLPEKKESALFIKSLYVQAGKADSALLYYDIAMATKDSITNADVNRKIDALKYAEDKKNQEIIAIQKETILRKKQYILVGILFLIICISVFLFLKNRLNQKAKNILEYENHEIILQKDLLKRKVETYEMQALKAQLNPHFIFNCLNSIDAFIYSNDKYKATTYLNKFAKLLRNILDSSKNNTVRLNQDIQSLQLYTELEELRNNYKFKTIYYIDESLETDQYSVPPLIIQPLVENAIIHGLKNRKEAGGLLEINIKKIDNHIEYKIIDNGIGRVAASQFFQSKKHSYGVELTMSRLKLFNQSNEENLKIEDILENGKVSGTKVSVLLSLQSELT